MLNRAMVPAQHVGRAQEGLERLMYALLCLQLPLQLPSASTPLNVLLPPGPAISIAMMASSSKGVVPLHYLVWQVS